jgi:hypothetical protein
MYCQIVPSAFHPRHKWRGLPGGQVKNLDPRSFLDRFREQAFFRFL